MKRRFPFALVIGALLVPVMGTSRAQAQIVTLLHSFWGGDGQGPAGPLVLVSNTLWGTTVVGSDDYGTVFSVKTDGTGFTNLHSFLSYGYNDGANSYAGLVWGNGTFYGTAFFGGSSGNAGTLFKMNTGPSNYVTLRYFSNPAPPNYVNSDGANSRAGLVLAGDTLYGVAVGGGTGAMGTVFRVNTNGTAFTNLHNFGPLLANTNTDGAHPYGNLILFSNTLFGTTTRGGFSGNGTVFRVNTDGTGFTNLYNFSATVSNTNSDGAWPYGGLALGGDTLFGTTEQGGPAGWGTIFSLRGDGSGFTNLHSFERIVSYGNLSTNSDGATPYGNLILAGDTLYGTGRAGGLEGVGTVFALNTNGTGFVNLHNFGSMPDGGSPEAGLILAGCTFYGTTANGGTSGHGTVFSLVLVPGIANISVSGSDLVVGATNGVANCTYTLLSAPSSALPLAQWTPMATNVPTRAGPFTFTLTNAFSLSQVQQFYTIKAQ